MIKEQIIAKLEFILFFYSQTSGKKNRVNHNRVFLIFLQLDQWKKKNRVMIKKKLQPSYKFFKIFYSKTSGRKKNRVMIKKKLQPSYNFFNFFIARLWTRVRVSFDFFFYILALFCLFLYFKLHLRSELFYICKFREL